MKLIEAVNAYLAAEEMSREKWPYPVALALVKVKRRVKDEVDFFLARERELVEEYAARDERGNIRLTSAGTFVFKDPAKGPPMRQPEKKNCARRRLRSTTSLSASPRRRRSSQPISRRWSGLWSLRRAAYETAKCALR